jgi:DNA-binding GntR family transcriptional regulator
MTMKAMLRAAIISGRVNTKQELRELGITSVELFVASRTPL